MRLGLPELFWARRSRRASEEEEEPAREEMGRGADL